MKFHLNTAEGNVFTGHGEGFVRIGETDYRENLLVTPGQLILGWAPGGFDTLSESDFTALAALEPEVALFGSGTTMRFPHPRLTRALTEAGDRAQRIAPVGSGDTHFVRTLFALFREP